MKRSFGLYRRTFGAKIVESFYDYDAQTIGPYKIPVSIEYKSTLAAGNSVAKWRFYDMMNRYESLLAIFNNNNYCFVAITADCVEFVPFFESDRKYGTQALPMFPITPPMSLPKYQHVGWVKTYQECKAIYTWPWKLLGDLDTMQVYDVEGKLDGMPLVNPPLSLYKYLIDTDYTAVYFDLRQNKPVFL